METQIPKNHLTHRDFLKLAFTSGATMAILFALIACSVTSTSPAPVSVLTDTPAIGMANPASIYCEQQGNKLEIRTAADGSQSGVCVFPDGSECNEWAYFRGECPAVTTAAPSPLPPLTGSGGGVIAYATLSGREWYIHIMNADGSGQRRLVADNKHGFEPGWSPDGTKIIYQYNGLFIIDVATGEISRLSLTREGDNLKNKYFVKPAWSPDGKWIAFLNEDGFRGDLYLTKPDGTSLTRLTNSNDISRDGNLVWSPDGTRLAFSVERDGMIEIYTMNIDDALQNPNDSHWIRLTNSSKPIRNLVTSWSPDGQWMAFSSTRDGNTEIYLMHPDGQNLVRLTNDQSSDSAPAWSPDGKQIAFLSDRKGNMDIYTMHVDEAVQGADNVEARQLTDTPETEAGPVWMPVKKETP